MLLGMKLSHCRKKTISGFALGTGLDEVSQHPEFLGPHAALAPDEADLAIAAALQRPGFEPGVFQDGRSDRHLREKTHAEICINHVNEGQHAAGRDVADLVAIADAAGRQCMITQTMAVLQQ